MQLTPLQSMASGFSAACIGPVATGPFDVVKVGGVVRAECHHASELHVSSSGQHSSMQ